MSRDPQGKQHRQQALLRLITEKRLSTQSALARALRGAGFAATQATISRDIEELGLVKVARGGAHVYAAPAAAAPGGGPDRLRRICEDYPCKAASAGNLVVVRSLPGTASALGAALDAAGLDGVIGSIAGDDTVFLAVASAAASSRLVTELATFGVRRNSRVG